MSWGVLGGLLGPAWAPRRKNMRKQWFVGPPKGEAKLVKNRHDGVPEGILSDKSHHLDCFLSVRV